MSGQQRNFAQDYIEVADRIREWYDRYPEGRIVTEIVESTAERVTVRAEVYRGYLTFSSMGSGKSPDDPIRRERYTDTFRGSSDLEEYPAGTGHSYLAIPGATPFTRGAELENAETSAIGRALVAAGIPSKHVASADEVRAKKNVGSAGTPGADAAPVTPAPSARRSPTNPEGDSQPVAPSEDAAPGATPNSDEYHDKAWAKLVEAAGYEAVNPAGALAAANGKSFQPKDAPNATTEEIEKALAWLLQKADKRGHAGVPT